MDGFCTRCGDCCERVGVQYTKEEAAEKLEEYYEHDPDNFNVASLELVRDHWEYLDGSDGNHFYSCNFLDRETRLCTNDNRPYICRGFPWYGDEPEERPLALGSDNGAYKRCGYWLDVPEQSRPKNFLPVIG